MPGRPELWAMKKRVSPTGPVWVCGLAVAVAQIGPRPETRYVSGSQDSGGKSNAARLAMPMALPAAFLQPSTSERSSSALAEGPTRAKSFAQALITQLVVALGLSWESQKSTTTLRPASPPLALRPAAHALTAFTEFWNRPGTSGLLTSAMMPTLMVVAVSPMSVPGPADPAGEGDWGAAAAAACGGRDRGRPPDHCQRARTRRERASGAAARAARSAVVSCHSRALHDFIACEL